MMRHVADGLAAALQQVVRQRDELASHGCSQFGTGQAVELGTCCSDDVRGVPLLRGCARRLRASKASS